MSAHERKAGLPLTLAAGAAALGYYLFLRPQMLKWGTRLGESQRRLPGDDIIPKPNLQMTHAIDIDAPPESLWPWLAQMGRERSGYYALDLVYNFGIPSVTFLRQDVPAPEVGMEMDGGMHIMELEPGRKLLFGGFSLRRPLGINQDVTQLYLLERQPDGSTRLIARRRAFSYGALGAIYNLADECVAFYGSQEQLQTLKRHAEGMSYLHGAAQARAETT